MRSVPLSPFAVGDVVGHWTVVGEIFPIQRPNKKRFYYPCRCVCGVEKDVLCQNLKTGAAQDCGCKRKEKVRATIKSHGQCGTRLYNIWRAMTARCRDTKRTGYEYYGGKGIRVCEEWHTFEPFAKWSEENGYADDLTIDRKESSGNYEPSNCRWVTDKVQKRNTRRALMLTAFGETKCAAEWLEDPRCRVAKGALSTRLKYGWDHEQAISTPVIDHPDTNRYRRDSVAGRGNHRKVRSE